MNAKFKLSTLDQCLYQEPIRFLINIEDHYPDNILNRLYVISIYKLDRSFKYRVIAKYRSLITALITINKIADDNPLSKGYSYIT